MRDCTYYNPVKIVSGINKIETIRDYLPEGRSLIITDTIFTGNGTAKKLSGITGRSDCEIFDGVLPNPELDDIDSAVLSFKDGGFESVIALGGGSVMDFAKAAAVFLRDGGNRTLDACLRKETEKSPDKKLFLLAIPTTAGTGSEVTPFATIWDSVTQKKFSLAGDMVFPSTAVLDPMLTVGLPSDGTLYTGLDVMSHSLESLWNRNSSPVSEAYALQSLHIALRTLPAVLENADNISARAEMQWAATLAGLAISQTRTAIAHSISYPLTLKFGVPHGLACGFTLGGLIDVYIDSTIPDMKLKELLKNVKNLLEQFHLKERTGRFASADQIKDLIGEMYNPARADNYIFKADEELIKKVLDQSV